MPLIKRYPNRKLYDTEAKRYVTLQDVTRLIQGGQEVQVVDYESGEDLTNLTLTQIILEQEKRSASGLIPRFLLTSMIRAGGDRLHQMRRSLGASGESGLDESAKESKTVTEQADTAIEQGQQMVDQVQALLKFDERIADVLHLLNVPSARDLHQLQVRIDELSAKLEALDRAQPASAEEADTSADGNPADPPA